MAFNGLMLVLVAWLLLLASAKPLQMKAVGLRMRQVVELCRDETGATDADFETLMRKEAAVSMQAKCLRACLMKKFNLMNADGKFNGDVALQITSQQAGRNAAKMRAATEIVNICQKLEVSENHCEAAEQYSKCASESLASSDAEAHVAIQGD